MTNDAHAPLIGDEGSRLLLQLHELQKRALAGRVPLAATRRGLQHLIMGQPVAGCDVPSLFVPLARQIANVEVWNQKFNWGFTPAAIARCAVDARSFEWPGDRLQAIVLVPSLGTVAETFSALAGIAGDRHPGSLHLWPHNTAANAKAGGIWLINGITFRPWTLEWRLIDLNAHYQPKVSPGHRSGPMPHAQHLVGPDTAAHAEALAAAAHFPAWLEAVRKGSAPSVCVPGYRFRESRTSATGVSYVNITFESGCIGTTLYQTSSDTVWAGQAIATVHPVPLGDNIM